MRLMILFLGLASCLMWVMCVEGDTEKEMDSMPNITHPDKDMYVIRATVYQVGILTNRTDNLTDNFNNTGNQESITLYHTNGTKIDLSGIPEPFQTNVTAQSIVGVAPVPSVGQVWNSLSHLENTSELPLGKGNVPVVEDKSFTKHVNKRSLDSIFRKLFKRDANDNTSVKVTNGAAMIPPEVGLQSISLPPLLSFNNNLSEIPVPIPNTSVIHYAKVNTLVQRS